MRNPIPLVLLFATALHSSLASARLSHPDAGAEERQLDGRIEREQDDVDDLRAFVVEGRVLLPGGAPAAGAVVVSDGGGKAVTDALGNYRLNVGIAADASVLQVTAVHSGLGSSLLASTRLLVHPAAGRARANDLDLGAGGSCAPSWLPTFGASPGVNGSINALAVYDDGSGGGPALFAAGSFTSAGGANASRIAKWDGTSWFTLGSGLGNTVHALTVYDDGTGGGPALYAGGLFTTAGGASARRVAKWDGSSWSALGSGLNNVVYDLAVHDDGTGGGPALCVGGDFTSAGGVSANRIAKWNGTAWSTLGSGMDDYVSALVVHDDGSGGGAALYAGGGFQLAGGVAASCIAKWNGTAWSALGSGLEVGLVIPSVAALAVHDDGSGTGSALFVGGDFQIAGGVIASNIAKWDGASWSALGSGIDSFVFALAVHDDGSAGGPALYAGGLFDTAGGASADNVAKWNGASWSTLGSGTDSTVTAFAIYDDGSGTGPALFAGGDFTSAGGLGASRIARWNGASWSALGGGNGLEDAVHALAVFDDGSGGGPALYAGGAFTSAGSASTNYIAKWDGTSWSPLGSGTGGLVTALAVHDDGSGSGPALYVGGWFTIAGGTTAKYIAKWNGTNWSALGNAMNDRVLSLAVYDDGGGPALYAGGWFSSPASRVARWDGTSWSSLGSGMRGSSQQIRVHALDVYDDGAGGGPALYAAGNFQAAGGVTVNHIAKWDGASWSALGSGLGNIALSLGIFDDGTGAGSALYVGGMFSTAGGASANRIAKWDGTWSALGSGMNERVWALEVYDDGSGGGPALYAAGAFTTAGGANASYIAKWNGTTWSGLDGWVDASVIALCVYDEGEGLGPALYAGGVFTVSAAGDSFLARWQGCMGNTGVAYCFGDGSASACPCGNTGGPGEGCANSSGSGAVAVSGGSTSASADDLTVFGSQLLPNQPALLFAGSNAVNGGAGSAFGDGLRCAGGQVRRMGVRTPNVLGEASWGPGLGATGGWSSGDTRRFQIWYRDPTGSPCGAGFNLSNGYELTFTN